MGASTRGLLVLKKAPIAVDVAKALEAEAKAKVAPKKVAKKDRFAFKKLEPAPPPMPMMPMPMMPMGGMPAQMPKAGAPPPDAGGGKAPIVVKSGGALTALTDKSVVEAKIKDIAVQIIGDDEGIDADLPLMQAGLTSNTAVMLRDELSKDIPGVNLPPTLMFDYPSIAAIADFIVEKATS